MTRRALSLVSALGLAVLVLGPALAPGYVLLYDMVFVPRQDLLPASIGLGGQLPRAVPQDAVLAALTTLAPGSVWQHLALLGAVAGGALGAARLLRGAGAAARAAAAVLFVWSAFFAERLLLGSWSLLVAVAVLPWALSAAIDARRALPGAAARLILLVGLASLTPTGGILACLLAGPVALGPGSRLGRARRAWTALALVALQLPWLVPSLLHPAAGASDPNGLKAFALRAEGPWGALVTALGTGGVWNGEVVLGSRSTFLAPLAAVLLTVLVVLGAPALVRHLGRAAALWLVVCAVAGIVVAVAGAWGPTRPLVLAAVDALPGGGLLRDGQKWLAPWTLLVAVAAPLGLGRIAERSRDATVRATLAVGLVLLPMATMPDLVWGGLGRMQTTSYPDDWAEVRTVLEADAAGGDVAVLPWSAFRAFAWNGGRTSLDPAPRYLPRPTVVDDTLLVARPDGTVLRVSGEDPRAAVVGAALDAGRPLAQTLPALGVRYVVVELTTPGPDVGSALDGLTPVVRGSTLELWSVPGTVAPPTGPSARDLVLVVLAWVAAGLVLITAGLQVGRAYTGGRRRDPGLATLRAVDQSKENT
ncbi:hypothetical protein [Longivirga aurantiaca]|uniref:YfhO family protein n=1 Tax=Longivirga aurantiaca TaxID=1837743 RepID=A0ABW1T274_9ACTN